MLEKFLENRVTRYAFLVLCFIALKAFSSPQTIRVDGSVYDNSGAPFTGSKDIQIRAYDAASGGTLLWTSSTYNTSVSSGRFTINLDASAGAPNLMEKIAERGSTDGVYFQVDVDTGAANGIMNIAVPVLPRIRAKGTMFALNSAATDGLKGVSATALHLNFLSGTTTNIQTQLNAIKTLASSPSAFSFTDQTDVAKNAIITSNGVVISGFVGALSGSCTDCTDIVRNGATLGTQGVFLSGDTVAIKQLSSVTALTTTTASLTVGATTSGVWSVTTVAPDPCEGSPSVGTVCSDGSVYAGLSSDGSVPMYTTRCMLGESWDGESCSGTAVTKYWDDGTNNPVLVGVTSTVTGESNTNTLVALGTSSSPAPYGAARACEVDIAGMHGRSDWYLPSKDELNVLYTNKTSIGGFGNNSYWSSTETNSGNAAFQFFSNGLQFSTGKSGATYVRCVRK